MRAVANTRVTVTDGRICPQPRGSHVAPLLTCPHLGSGWVVICAPGVLRGRAGPCGSCSQLHTFLPRGPGALGVCPPQLSPISTSCRIQCPAITGAGFSEPFSPLCSLPIRCARRALALNRQPVYTPWLLLQTGVARTAVPHTGLWRCSVLVRALPGSHLLLSSVSRGCPQHRATALRLTCCFTLHAFCPWSFHPSVHPSPPETRGSSLPLAGAVPRPCCRTSCHRLPSRGQVGQLLGPRPLLASPWLLRPSPVLTLLFPRPAPPPACESTDPPLSCVSSLLHCGRWSLLL